MIVIRGRGARRRRYHANWAEAAFGDVWNLGAAELENRVFLVDVGSLSVNGDQRPESWVRAHINQVALVVGPTCAGVDICLRWLATGPLALFTLESETHVPSMQDLSSDNYPNLLGLVVAHVAKRLLGAPRDVRTALFARLTALPAASVGTSGLTREDVTRGPSARSLQRWCRRLQLEHPSKLSSIGRLISHSNSVSLSTGRGTANWTRYGHSRASVGRASRKLLGVSIFSLERRATDDEIIGLFLRRVVRPAEASA